MLPCVRLLPWAAAFLAAAAAAQSTPPATAGAAAAPLSYRSPLAGYRPLTEEEVIPWRETNDTVGRIGGWREYARESSQPAASAPKPGASPAPAAPAGHGGHQH